MYLISSRATLRWEEGRQVSARRPNKARERSGLEGGVPASVLVVGAVVSVRLDAPLAEVSRHGGEVLPCWARAGFEVGRRVDRVGRRSPGVWPAARCADEESRFGIGGFESQTSFSGPGLRTSGGQAQVSPARLHKPQSMNRIELQ
jgi:hypothetical protein